MPALPEVQPLVKKWVTLPQALRWIVEGIEPDLAGEPGTLPSFPEGDTSCKDLYRYWISGEIELYGQLGLDAEVLYDDSFSPIGVECRSLGEFKKVRVDHLRKAGINAIDWKCSSFYTFIYNEEDQSHYIKFCWENLKIRWGDLLRLATKKKISNPNQTESQDPSTGKKSGSGRPKRKDWPLMAALVAIIWECEPTRLRDSDLRTYNRVKEILSKVNYHQCGLPPSADGPDIPARDGLVRHAIVSVEHARKLKPSDKDTSIKKRLRHREKPPNIQRIVFALVATIAERKSTGWPNLSDRERHKNIVEILKASSNTGFDDDLKSVDLSLIGEGIVFAGKAKELYEQGER